VSQPGYRGRFAPSPTGPLHFGSLVAALGSWLDARHHGGRWLLRIEDIDPPRQRQGAVEAQLRTLQAFGLEPDEPPWCQSARSDAYEAALAELGRRGLLFECRCSRSDLAEMGGIHVACVARPSGRHPALRLRTPDQVLDFDDRLQGRQSQSLRGSAGDVVLRRADGLYAYQLAVVVDDAAQGITVVVRGADLLESTPRQIALQQALGLHTPRYMHLPLVLDAQGAKLGKSLAAMPLRDDAPLPALRAAWRFLLPELCLPGGDRVSTWLENAAGGYRPEALHRQSKCVPGWAGDPTGIIAT
jgi:glutamyl-Q tRNA(Asp) synthetase